jgi:hypothetical protein
VGINNAGLQHKEIARKLGKIGGTTLHSFAGIGSGTAVISKCIELAKVKKIFYLNNNLCWFFLNPCTSDVLIMIVQ